MEEKEKFDIFKKLLSGRFWTAIIVSIVFAYATYANILSSEQVNAIVLLVISFYFSKKS